MNHLNSLESKLRRETAVATASPRVEAFLLREFDARKRRRRLTLAAPLALAAALLISLRPAPAPKPMPAAPAPHVAAAVVPPAPARIPAAKRRPPLVQPVADRQPAWERIPFSPPLEAEDRTEIIRVEVTVAALLASGIKIPFADAGAKAIVDVLVGQDGIARAVRIISIRSEGGTAE